MGFADPIKQRKGQFQVQGDLLNAVAHEQIQGAQLAEQAFKNRVAPLFNTISEFEQESTEAFGPFAEGGANAFTSFLNTLGVAGPNQDITSEEASQLGLEQFQGSTQRRFLDEQLELDQQAFSRQAAATGSLASGNFASALQELGQTRANQTFGQFQQGLFQGAGLGLQGLAQQQQARQFALQSNIGLTTGIADVEAQSKLSQGAAKAAEFQGLLGLIKSAQSVNTSAGNQNQFIGALGIPGKIT